MDPVKKKTNLVINHSENMYKNILITGCLGFIGSNPLGMGNLEVSNPKIYINWSCSPNILNSTNL